ncbi:MAG: hypothetical protein Q9169_002901 [Polycauliona sp. 2 TL-2023]
MGRKQIKTLQVITLSMSSTWLAIGAMASTDILSSASVGGCGVFRDLTKDTGDVSQREIPYGGDIHKLRDDYDTEIETRCRADDARIRGFAPWSSPISNPTTTQVRFKYRANGHYLEFLSLFLTGERQVDIDFPRRHALVCFLLEGLEESHYQYAKRMVPKEIEKMQMISADEMELQVWQAFIRAPYLNLGIRDHATDEDRERYLFSRSVNKIRQLAIHRSSTYRWNFDTRIIKSAAACAQYLGDDDLLVKIELLIKVLYVDAGGVSEHAMTEDERRRAYDLLWPCNRQPATIHQLLDRVQTLAEKSSYNFCQDHLPQELLGFGCTAAEHFELSQWRKIITYRCHTTSDDSSFTDLDMQLQKADVSNLRNAASHRQSFILYPTDDFYDDTPTLKAHLRTAKAYVRALGDEVTALEIERLENDVLPALSKKLDDEWLDPQWCDGKGDLELIRQALANTRSYWDREQRHIWKSMEVNITPILPVYGRAELRLSLLERKLGLNDDTTPEATAKDCGETPSVESPADRKSLDSLLYRGDSSVPTEQDAIDTPSDADVDTSSDADIDPSSGTFDTSSDAGSDTSDSSDRDSEGSADSTADWGDSDDIPDPAADQGIAIGGWNDDDDDDDDLTCPSLTDDTDQSTGTDEVDTDATSDADDMEESEWLCPGSAADQGIAVGGWD